MIDPSAFRPRRPLARRLMARLAVFGVVVSLIISALAIAIDYQLVKDRALERFDQIRDSYLASIVENTWLMDGERLGVLVLGIRNLPYIEWVEVVDHDGGVLASAGRRGDGASLSRSYELTRPYLGQMRIIGRLEVTASLVQLRQPVIERAWLLLLANLAIVLSVSVLVYWLVYPLVTQPLDRMARYARSLGKANLTDPPPLVVAEAAANDEFLDLAIAFGDMRDAIRRSYLALQESEARHRMLFTSSPVSLWEEDFSGVKAALDRLRRENGDDLDAYLSAHPEVLTEYIDLVIVLDVNTATLDLHHAPDRESLLGELGKTLTAGSTGAIQRQVQAIWRGECQLALETQVRTLDGDIRDVMLHWLVPLGHRERFDRVIVALEDITERKAAEQSLSMTVEKMVQANSELERFAYVAAHDLREPVRGIVSFAQLLERRLHGKIDQEAAEFLQFLVSAAERMQQQVQGLLGYSRVGASERGYQPLSLDKALASAVETLADTIAATRASIEAEPLPDVVGDASQLAEVFQHLLGNALKFARSGITPWVRVSARRSGDDWVFTVRDNGIGIDSRYAGEIFQVFRRLHGPGVYPGAGIGLATCRRIIERHGGRIWVDFDPGDGATIRFSLPAMV
ncbi:MAG: HAMP domain-containing protein [Magnetospirillum sp.]|nr:MAG: HAMP domain-containing protein [Magnetospirillum sp.]